MNTFIRLLNLFMSNMVNEQTPKLPAYMSAVARLMDSAVRVPGTRWRIGLDGVIGLIPGVGDTLGAAVSSVIIMQAALSGIPIWVLLRMVLNVAVEWAVGLIPLVGDLFDFAWKANSRNVMLYIDYFRDPHAIVRKSAVSIIFSSIAVLAVFIGAFVGFLFLLRWVWQFVTG